MMGHVIVMDNPRGLAESVRQQLNGLQHTQISPRPNSKPWDLWSYAQVGPNTWLSGKKCLGMNYVRPWVSFWTIAGAVSQVTSMGSNKNLVG